MNNLAVMFSKKSDHWATPKDIYKYFMDNNYYDPCPLNSINDNLDQNFNVSKMFINPPYSDIISWVDFAIRHKMSYNTKVVMLVPARTDTKWFHKALQYGATITFIKGRLKFNDQGCAPFPSIYLIFNNSLSNEI
jgi:site-specific DNA-methyltransferase (adenine-specific)